MSSTSILIAIAALVPFASGAYIASRGSAQIGLFHLYLIMVGVTYGAYTLVDLGINGVSGIDPSSALITLLFITLSMFVMDLVFRALPSAVRSRTSFAVFIQATRDIPDRHLLLMWGVVLAWHVYAYVTYGIVSHYSEPTLREKFLFNIPTWVGPIRYLAISIGFALFIVLGGKIFSQPRQNIFSFRVLMLITLFILLAVNGRRMVLHLVILLVLTYFVARGQIARMFATKNVVRMALAVVAVTLFSNIYQTARVNYLQHEALESDKQYGVSLLDAAFDFDATKSNLEQRTATWRFHAWLTEYQLYDPSDVMGGRLVWEGFVSIVPRILWPEKSLVQEDFLICSYYSGMCPHFSPEGVDYPQTIFSVLQADFGFLYIFFMPLVLVSTLWVAGSVGRASKSNSWLAMRYGVIFGVSGVFIMNVEQNIGDWFNWFRNVVIIYLAFFLAGVANWHSDRGLTVRGRLR